MIWSNYWAKNTQETKSIQVEGRRGKDKHTLTRHEPMMMIMMRMMAMMIINDGWMDESLHERSDDPITINMLQFFFI